MSLISTSEKSVVPRARWHSAFLAIYCSRAFSSCIERKDFNKINVDNSFGIDQTTLTEIVHEKNLECLQKFGGVNWVASALQTNVEHGIQDNDVNDIARRSEAFGSNAYGKPPSKGFFHFVVEAFKDLTVLILLGCAALSLAFGIKVHGLQEGWRDGGSIFVAVFVVIAVSSISNFRQNRQFDKLAQASNNVQIEVVRNGRRQQVSIFEILVGDVVCLKIGDQVPADGLFLEGHSLQVDESSMPGESDHVEVNSNHNPFLFSGTKVVDGHARMLVTSVGMNTTWGHMMSSISKATKDQTPLQARLNKLTSSIGKVVLAMAFLVFLVLLIRYVTENTTDNGGNKEYNGSKTKNIVNALVGIVAAAVTIIVVAIPEGLPLAVILTLAYSMKKMITDQAMVRKLSACETLGSATVICTDKTGTLTLNEMNVTKFSLGQDPVEECDYSSIAPCVAVLIREGAALNTTGSVYKSNSDNSEFEFSESPTEKAILSWAVSELRMEMPQMKQDCTVLHLEAFNSEKKRSGVLIRRKADNTIHVHWKGAAEVVLKMCSRYYDASGVVKDLDNASKVVFENNIVGMAAKGLHCIAFAHMQVSEDHEDQVKSEKLEVEGLALLGLVGLKNPCRREIRKAVLDCQREGVQVKMVTGDDVFTAKAIATECGILKAEEDSSEAVVEGKKFREYPEDERLKKVDNICVMARCTPFDKCLMVQCLKQNGHVVAVTGDGTNDAPALKEADIGLSNGIHGTAVCRESPGIIVMDENFAIIPKVLRLGRRMRDSSYKLIAVQLTMNVVALAINMVGVFYQGEVPLTAGHLLLGNIILYTLGTMGLATQKITMQQETEATPVQQETKNPVLSDIIWDSVAKALYLTALIFILQLGGESVLGADAKQTNIFIFHAFMFYQVYNEFYPKAKPVPLPELLRLFST